MWTVDLGVKLVHGIAVQQYTALYMEPKGENNVQSEIKVHKLYKQQCTLKFFFYIVIDKSTYYRDIVKNSVADPDPDPVFFGHPDPDPGKYRIRIRILYPQKDPMLFKFSRYKIV